MLPKPLPFVEKKPLPDSQPDVKDPASAADSVVVNQIDSLGTGPLKEKIDTLKSGLLKATVTGTADSLSVKADSTARQNNHNSTEVQLDMQ